MSSTYPPSNFYSLSSLNLSNKFIASIGRWYTLVDNTNLGAGASMFFALETGPDILNIEAISMGSTSPITTVDMFENSDWVSGTGSLLQSFNRNRNFKNVLLPVVEGRKNPTINSNGTLLETFSIYGDVSGIGSNKEALAQGEITYPYILEPNTQYLICVTNSDVSARDYRIAFQLSY